MASKSVFVALLRAVNVGGTGVLSMSDLRDLAEAAGFTNARTYIQSGNLVLESALDAPKMKAKLEKALATKMGKPIGVMVRSAEEMNAVLTSNPFPDAAPNQTLVMFLDDPPAKNVLDDVVMPDGERARLGAREIYIHYPKGMGRSKLKVPGAKTGTGRNLNTIAKLVAMTT